MGTNYYIRGRVDDDYEGHIGKRSAAGLYCFDCDLHLGCGSKTQRCHQCGLVHVQQHKMTGPVAVELGFEKPSPLPTSGVHGCSKFTWDMHRAEVSTAIEAAKGACPTCERKHDDAAKVIENEYGDLFTFDEFMEKVVEACAVQSTDSIGRHFS